MPPPKELTAAIRYVCEPAGMKVTSTVQREAESSEYGASRFKLEGHTIAFRIAKTTPTRKGQFVTIWKRTVPDGTIMPLDISDGIDFVVISVADISHRGYFVFDQELMIEKGIMSHHGKGGKRAIRVYPPWTSPLAQTALKTQQWQLRYFLPLTANRPINARQVHKLFKSCTPNAKAIAVPTSNPTH